MSSNHALAEHGQGGASHGSVGSYIVGFFLSIALTLVPYFIVANHLFPPVGMIATIVVAALLQLVVQLVFFLHLSNKSESRWNLMAFLFTTIVVFFLVAGSLWIMYNLNYNMMENIH